MNVNPWLLDGVAAAALAAVVLLATPGVAIAALLGVLVLLLCGISLLWERRQGRRRGRRRTPRRPRL